MVTRLRHNPVPPGVATSRPSVEARRADPPPSLTESTKPTEPSRIELTEPTEPAPFVATAPLPLPGDGLAALVDLLAEVERRGGSSAAAVRSLLAGLHRSFALLTPGYPTAAAPSGLWGFSPAPASTLDELDAQINRLEDVLLQLLPAPDEEQTL